MMRESGRRFQFRAWDTVSPGCIQPGMQLEQQPPNRPNFLKIVLLSGAAIIVIFIIAIFVLHMDGGRLTHERYRKQPTSRLVLPVPVTHAVAPQAA